jgi:hypothetical protein
MPRLRPRISLRNLLLLMTCVALAVVLRQTRQQIPPIQAEIRLLRMELGFLTIDHPEKITAIKLQTGDPLTWQWRIYLPAGRKYRLRLASGFLPDEFGPTQKAWNTLVQPLRQTGAAADRIPTLRKFWFNKILELGAPSDIGPAELQGELILEARVVNESGAWLLKMHPGGEAPILQPNGDWLSDHRSRSDGNSDVPMTEQRTFTADTRVVLARVRRPIITETSGSWSSTSPVGDADSFILWLEPEPAPAAD